MKRIAYLCPTTIASGPNAFDQACKKEFFSDVFCLCEDEPNIRYLKIKIKVIKKETRYKTDRKKKWYLFNKKEKK